MRSYELIRELEDKGNDVHHTSKVLVKLPNGEFGYVKDVTVVNGEIVITATLDARDVI